MHTYTIYLSLSLSLALSLSLSLSLSLYIYICIDISNSDDRIQIERELGAEVGTVVVTCLVAYGVFYFDVEILIGNSLQALGFRLFQS